jgi:hypothetical protein
VKEAKMIVDVQIEGVTAFLMHKFSDHDAVEGVSASRNVLVQRGTPREEAEKVTYRNATGQLYFPSGAIGRLLREAGGAHKMKGTRKSAKYLVPAAVIILEDAIIFLDQSNKPMKEFEVDSRPVTIPATKGRIMRHRPRLDVWRASFSLRVNETVLPIELIHKLLVDGGEQIGIGDYRPEKGGPFGTFRVLHWTEKIKPVAEAAE